MPPAPTKRARGHLGRGILLSLLLHAQLLAPLAIAAFVYGGREEARRAEEVDVAFESVAEDELPRDLPSFEPPKSDETALERLRPEAKKEAKKPPKKKPERDKKPLVAKDEPKSKPEPEIVVPPLPPMPPPPPSPPPPERGHEKMVDVDTDKNVSPPPDAKFLAEKNNRVAEETRATETNLEKNHPGESAASAPSDRQDEQVGADKQQIRQLADEKSALGKKAPAVTPHANPELAPTDAERRERSLLALRDPAPRTHEITPETADPSLPHAADGELRERRPTTRGADSRADKANAKRVKLAITGSDYEYIFGADAEADRRLAKKLKSTRLGKFAQRQARIKSALENFIPEVKPGNQTALNTRAAPFAAFVARMHRSIHMLWGFGMIEDWDDKPGTGGVNDPNLLTTLEMVLNADGTVNKVTVVRASGNLEYDVAAIDVAYSAGPYPDPPREIRSANGRIYLHWRFYRDARECATSGVDYFILDNPPADADKASSTTAELDPRGGPRVPRSPAAGEGPRHLHRDLGDDAHRAKMQALDGEVARAAGSAAEETPPSATPPVVSQAEVPAARATVERWFAALVSGDIATAAALAEVPFRTTGGSSIRGRADLTATLKDLSTELARDRPNGIRVFSAAGIRGVVGRLPPGIDDGSGLLFALVPLSHGDSLLAALAKRGDGFRVVALVRR
jgi:TonB family protein